MRIRRCAMHDTSELRDGLAELAKPVIPAEGYESQIMRRAHRIRGRRRIAGNTVKGAADGQPDIAFELGLGRARGLEIELVEE